jgi:hypothetical protein
VPRAYSSGYAGASGNEGVICRVSAAVVYSSVANLSLSLGGGQIGTALEIPAIAVSGGLFTRTCHFSVAYTAAVSVLVEGPVKEQQRQMKHLRSENEAIPHRECRTQSPAGAHRSTPRPAARG